MQIRSKFVVCLIPVLGALGCGDDDGGGGGSGVSGDKKLEDLTEAEAKELCVSTQKKFERVAEATHKLSCVLGGIVAGAAACEAGLDDCLAEPAEEDGELSIDCEDSNDPNSGLPDDCDITVDELNACVDALEKATGDAADKVSCSSELADLTDSLTPVEPKACADISDRCDLAGEL